MRNKNPLTFILFFFILAIGFLLRAQEMLSHNFLFLIDQGRDMMAVKDIVYNHHLTLIGPYTSLTGVFQGPIWYYLLSIPTFILNGDPWGAVVLMLTISMALIIISFIFMRKLFDEKTALVTSFLLAISPEAISAATYSWNPHPMWLLIGLFIFFFYKVNLGQKKYHLFLWPLISLMFHFEGALAFFILIASFIYLLLFNRRVINNKYFAFSTLSSILLFLPQILFDLRHNFLMSRSFLSLFQGKDNGLIVGGEKLKYLNLMDSHIYAFKINFISSFLHDGLMQNLPLFFFVFLVFMVLFAKRLKIVSDNENYFLMMIVKTVLIIVALTFFYPFPLRYWFLTGFEIFYIFPLGLLLSKLLNLRIGKIFLLLLFVASILVLAPKINKLYSQPDYGGVAKIKGKIDAIKYIYDDAKGKPFNLLVFTPPVSTDAYDYLLWWYGKNKKLQVPKKEKKETFYLLMEPDPGKPWSYNGWLETIIKNGTIISTKTLPSGLIVQKRIEY